MRKSPLIGVALALTCALLHAQSIVTIAGGGSDDGRPAREAAIAPWGVAVDSSGNVFIADYYNYRIRKVTPSGTIFTAVGTGSESRGRDGIPVTGASMGSPTSVVVNAAGDLYFADPGYARVRKVTAATGIINTVAGTEPAGFSGDNGPATQARLNNPERIAIDGAGNLYIADTDNHRLRKVDAAGVITTIAGTGTSGYAGDGGSALAALLSRPRGMVVAPNGDIFFCDSGNHAVRRIRGGTITTIAGTGSAGSSGDGGPASAATLNGPRSIDLDAAGNLYVADRGNHRIRRIDTSGNIATVAGGGSGFGEGGPATSAALNEPEAIAVDRSGNLFIADTENSVVRRVNASDKTIHTVAGNREQLFYGGGDGGPATSASLNSPQFLAVDASGNLLIAERRGYRVRKVLRGSGTITTVAGTGDAGYRGDGGLATQARIRAAGVAVDAQGNVYLTDFEQGHVIRKVSASSQIITTFAGTGSAGSGGDGGPAASAQFREPHGLAIDPTGSFLYVADSGNHRIRRIDLSSTIITNVAGTGTAGFSGDNGPATAATLNLARNGIAFDPAGNLYIADTENHRVRKVALPSGTITTVAGSGGNLEFGGDNGPAILAKLARPRDVFVDENSNLYIVDAHNGRLRKVDLISGIITTVAGTGDYDFLGDGGPATQARLAFPWAVTVDATGNIYISDTDNQRVRAILACVSVGGPSLAAPANGASNVATGPTLRWNRVEGAFRYDVYLDTIPNPQRLVASDVTSTSATIANLLPSTKYYWRVEAKGDPFCTPVSRNSSQIISFTTVGGCVAPATFEQTSPADGAGDAAAATTLTWQAAAGAAAYDLFFGSRNPPPQFATTSSTSAAVTGLAPGTTYYWFVRARSACEKSAITSVRSFRTAGACGAAAAFNPLSPASGARDVPTTTTLSWSPSANASSYDLYFGAGPAPPLYLSDLTKTAITLVGLAPAQLFSWRVEARAACNGTKTITQISTFTTGQPCNAADPPTITFVPPGNVGAGQTYIIAWADSPTLDAGGVYLVERSLDAGFGNIFDSQQIAGTSASFLATAAGIYHHRVRAIQSCAPASPGPPSASRTVTVVAAAPNVVFTVQPQAVVSTLGENLEYYKSVAVVENIGPLPLQVLLGRQEINSIPFFRVIDPSGADAAFLTLEPRKPKILEIRYSGPPNNEPRSYQGVIFLAATGQGLGITPYAFVNLKVGGGDSGKPVFLVNGRASEYAFFPGHAGDDASRQPISVTIQNPGSTPMELAAEIAPEVWLRPEEDWNISPIGPGGSRVIRLFTDRSRAPNGSALPRYTYFTVRSKNGQTARLLVQDNDALPTAAGRSTLLEPGSRSYIVAGVIGSGTSVTRLRLTNIGSEAVQAELFFTPEGADGFDVAAVRRATVVIPPNDVVTLTDPLQQVFALTSQSTGQVEVRAASDRIGSLLVSAAVVTPSSGGGAYSYQLPVLRLGEGAGIGAGHLIAGVTAGTPGIRSSLLLTETSGTEGTRVRATLFDAQGNQKGAVTEQIARYGQKTVDLAPLSGGSAIDGGRIDLTVESGGGTVVGEVTMLDDTRSTGATAVSQPAGGGGGSASAMRALQTVSAATAVAPVVVNATTARTSMGFSLSGATSASAVITYRPSDPNASAVERTVQLFPRLSVNFENVLEQLFGVEAGKKAEGSVFVRAAEGAQIYARLQTLAGGKWGATGSLPIFPTVAEVMTSVASRRPLYLDGLEQSVDLVRGSRWTVVLSETSGSGGSVRVRLYEAGNRRLPIGEGVFTIRGYEQLRLESVFAALGLETEERKKDRANVLCMVMAEGGGAVVSAVGVSTDNVTGDTKHHVFSPTGGVPATGVIRISVVKPVDAPAAGGRRRVVRP